MNTVKLSCWLLLKIDNVVYVKQLHNTRINMSEEVIFNDYLV